MQTEFSISVIIPVLNEENHISPCLDSILSQTRRHIEVIVVDNGSSDGTVELVEKFVKMDNRVRLIREDKKGIVVAKNRGIKEARGKVIAFTDADCVAVVSWLGSLIKHFQGPRVGSVGGPSISPKDDTVLGNIIINSLSCCFPAWKRFCEVSGGFREIDFNPPCNVMYPKRVFDELGGFKEDLYPFEDEEMICRIKDKGYKVYYDPDAIVYHYRKTSVPDVLKLSYRTGNSRATALKRHLKMGKFPYSLPLSVFYVSALFLILPMIKASFIYPSAVYFSLLVSFGIAFSLSMARKTRILEFPLYLFFLVFIVVGWNFGFLRDLFFRKS